MDFEAYYAAQEETARVAHDAKLVEQYNRWVTAARAAVPQIVAQARITPPKQYERLNIGDRQIIAWKVCNDYDTMWKVYIATSGDIILYVYHTFTYQTVTLAPIRRVSDINEHTLDVNQLREFIRSLPSFAQVVGYVLSATWQRYVEEK